MAATYNKFQDFTEQLIKRTHDWENHTFKVCLTNSEPDATQTGLDLSTLHPEPTTASGYPAGGLATTITTSETGGQTTVSGSSVTFEATGGTIGPFRYVIFYNDSVVGKPLISWWDYGASVTLNNTETFVIKFNNTDPGVIFNLT